MNNLLVLIFLSVNLTFGAKLPSYFKKCDHTKNFNECIKSNIDNSLELLSNEGDKSIKLPKLNPMFVKEAKVAASPDLTITLKDAYLFGFNNVKMESVNMDIDKAEFNINYTLRSYAMVAMYDINGKIMVIPIQGNGRIVLNTTDVRIEYTSKLVIVKKDGGEFYKITDYKVVFEPKLVHYQLDNLFNGDVQLGNQMNLFLNENWMDVFQEVKQGFQYILGILLTKIINTYFGAVPISELYT